MIDMFKATQYCCGSPFLIALAILPPLLDFVFSPPLGKRSRFEKASLCRRPYALETLGVNYGREGWRYCWYIGIDEWMAPVRRSQRRTGAIELSISLSSHPTFRVESRPLTSHFSSLLSPLTSHLSISNL